MGRCLLRLTSGVFSSCGDTGPVSCSDNLAIKSHGIRHTAFFSAEYGDRFLPFLPLVTSFFFRGSDMSGKNNLGRCVLFPMGPLRICTRGATEPFRIETYPFPKEESRRPFLRAADYSTDVLLPIPPLPNTSFFSKASEPFIVWSSYPEHPVVPLHCLFLLRSP